MNIENSFEEITIAEIVTNDFRAAEIFKKSGIDFCCGGNKSLEQACKEKNLEPAIVASQLKKLGSERPEVYKFNEWNLDFLCDYIVNIHHKYVLRNLPNLVFYTRKIADVHGQNHPELAEVANLFGKINQELLEHLRNEEDVLFPAIKAMTDDPDAAENRSIIQSEITRMLGEHDFAGGAMDDINIITSGYALPEDACNTYQVTFKLLRQFEDDLHVHVHLENNILFPKALKL
jgi:regulator of cell morphogenesis and NO signaling